MSIGLTEQGAGAMQMTGYVCARFVLDCIV